MDVSFFGEFKDPYLGTEEGQGAFLSGVSLGMLARGQIAKGASIDSSPLYKQLRFGRLQRRNITALMSRVPELARATMGENSTGLAGMIESLCAKAGDLIMRGGDAELGVNGNFAFSVAFMNAPDYFYGKIFKKKDKESEASDTDGTDRAEEGN